MYMRAALKTLALSSCVVLIVPAPSLAQTNQAPLQRVYIEPHPAVQSPLLDAPPQLTPERLQRYEEALRKTPGPIVVPVDPRIRPEDIRPSVAQTPVDFPEGAGERAPGPRAPGDFTFFRLTTLNDAATNNSTSSRSGEPSLGVNGDALFWSGNWYAAVSADGGQNFGYIDPADNFPADGVDDPVNAGFCCDQIVYYEQTRDAMFWLLQYSADANTNTQRIAVANSPDDVVNNNWFWYDFTPADFGFAATGFWLDFPDLSVSNNFLYLTTNVFPIGGGSSSTAVFARFPLDPMSQGAGFTFGYLVTDRPGLRCTHGACDVMYFGAHNNTGSIRIYRLAENSNTVTWDDVAHGGFNLMDGANPGVAPGPDGRDWAGFADNRILGAYRANSVLGFMFGARQGGGFAFPQVQVLRFNESDRSLLSQQQVWNPNNAWLYPSVHPNDRGHLGGTIAFGGGAFYPNGAAWIADDVNGGVIAPLENLAFTGGNSGPAVNRWGDYLTTRRNVPFGFTWGGAAWGNVGGPNNTDAEPRYVWFGRERDKPIIPPVAVCESVVTKNVDADCCVTVTVADIDAGSFDPNGPGEIATICITAVDGVSVGCVQSVVICDDLGPHTVTLTVTDVDGESDSCDAVVVARDIMPPVLTCPADVTIECDQPTDPSNTGLATATDNCDPNPVICYVDRILPGSCPQEFTIGRLWKATDASGNLSACMQTITVVDTTAPVITCPDNVTVECTSGQGAPVASVPLEACATDNCDTDVTITDDKPPDFYPPTCGGPPNIVTFTATDDCGNVSTCQVEVEVVGPMCCPAIMETDLTLMPAHIDLTQGAGPVTTKAVFDIWNELEVKFSGTERCVTCWDQTLLSDYTVLGIPNNFLIENLQTDKGKARIDGTANAVVCPDSVETPLLGLAIKELLFAGSSRVDMRSALMPVGTGVESAQILYDVSDVPDELKGLLEFDDVSHGRPQTRGMNIQRMFSAPGESDPQGGASGGGDRAAGLDRASVSQKGSLLYWLKVEIKWNARGELIQDTFLDLTNDYTSGVFVQLFYVNGDEAAEALVDPITGGLLERAHPGWNKVDFVVPMTMNQPMYWSAFEGGFLSSFTILDPGFDADGNGTIDPYERPGRPDPDPLNPGGRVLRGFVVGWAVSFEGKEINWNHLKGDAVVLNYADATAYEYETWAIQCVSGVDTGDECDGTPGQLNMDSVEYEYCPAKLLLDFYASGSSALTRRGGP